jgi:hypothetical protein
VVNVVYHEFQMRRGFSIFLILTFALGPLSALADGSEDANLPACCRQLGAHHCAMSVHRAAIQAEAESDKTTSVDVPSTCPQYPGLAAMFAAPAPALAASPAAAGIAVATLLVWDGGREVILSAAMGTHAGRGPPQAHLS